ncbi:MAG: type II toxin-antitoxin system HicB family antitoxin [Gammaproteobacteria bacterium]
MKDIMHYRGYFGSVHFDNEGLFFYGKIEFVRALISYEATDAKGIKKAFEEAVDDYLEMCERQHIKPEIPFKGSLNIRLGSDLHRKVAIAAELNHLTINKFIVQTLDRVISN